MDYTDVSAKVPNTYTKFNSNTIIHEYDCKENFGPGYQLPNIDTLCHDHHFLGLPTIEVASIKASQSAAAPLTTPRHMLCRVAAESAHNSSHKSDLL